MDETGTITPEEAAETFVKMVIACAYEGGIRITTSHLEKGPAGKKPPEDLVSQHEWFQSLAAEDAAMVKSIVRRASESAVFECLVLLDGMTGGYPVKGQPSEFALYLQVYDDLNAEKADTPRIKTRVNDPTLDHLHDVFKWKVAERKESGL